MKNTPKALLPLAVVSVLLAGVSVGSAATTAYRNLILGDSPIVYYELDETSGTTAVNSATTGAIYDGTFNTDGGSVSVNQVSFAQGGTCYDFDGGFIGAGSALTDSLDEWTVEAWVNYDAAKISASNFLSNDQGGWNDDVLFGIGAEAGTMGVPGGHVGLIHHGNPGTTRDFVESPLAAGEWHHVVVTGSTTAGALTLYVDGVLAGSDTSLVNGVTFNGADGIGTANLTVGAARPDAANAGYRPYDGLLDEVAIYDQVLDAGAIAGHFNAGTIPSAPQFRITKSGSDLVFRWDSRAGKLYNLRSETDPSKGEPKEWPIYDGNVDIVATPDTNILTIALPTDRSRYFVIEESPAPPVSVFSDDFENGQNAWVVNNGTPGTTPATNWEFGTPDSNLAGGPAAANSGPNCFGTNLADHSGINVEISLVSPVIDLTTTMSATLNFAHFRDIETGFDLGEVRVLDADNADAVLAVVETEIDGTADWEGFTKALPSEALGKNVKIEFFYDTEEFNDRNYAGWYIDDVTVTVP